ncbi:hypothetical protein OC835_000786 [Tilletia horrida]|nr:hypothetical protein OC835_000786 [Tilletia horrida]
MQRSSRRSGLSSTGQPGPAHLLATDPAAVGARRTRRAPTPLSGHSITRTYSGAGSGSDSAQGAGDSDSAQGAGDTVSVNAARSDAVSATPSGCHAEQSRQKLAVTTAERINPELDIPRYFQMAELGLRRDTSDGSGDIGGDSQRQSRRDPEQMDAAREVPPSARAMDV